MSTNLFEKFQKTGWTPFDTYLVKINLRDIVGGMPMDPQLVEKWVKATNKEAAQEERDKLRDADLELLPDVADEKREAGGICFGRKDGQLILEGRHVKAMLREASNCVRDTLPGGAVKQLKSKVADQVFVTEDIIPLGREKPDAVEERPIHVTTPQGKRNAIKVYEICRDVELHFTVKRNARHSGNKMAVSEKALLATLSYGQEIGLGADRSQGRGRFKVLSVEKIGNAQLK